LYYLHLTIYGR